MALGPRVPSAEMSEVEAMATHLGMDVKKDRDLLWIAHQALHAPRPSGWRDLQDADGKVYYVEQSTGHTSWWLPTDDEFRRLYKKKRAEKANAAKVQPFSCSPSSTLSGASRPGSSVSAIPPIRARSARGASEIERVAAQNCEAGSLSARPSTAISSTRSLPPASGASARSIVVPGGERRPSGAVLLPSSPRQRMRAEFWANVSGPHDAARSGQVAQWQQSLVERVKLRVATREHVSNTSARHAARARSRREDARARSRAVGQDVPPPRRDPALSHSSLHDIDEPPLLPTEGEESMLQLRQAEYYRWRDEYTKLELQAQDIGKAIAQRREALNEINNKFGCTSERGWRAQQETKRLARDREVRKRRNDALQRAILAEKRVSELDDVNAQYVKTINELREHRQVYLSAAKGVDARIAKLARETPHLKTFCENALNTRDRLVRQLSKMQEEFNTQVRQHRSAMLSLADDDKEEQAKLDYHREQAGDVSETRRRLEYARLRDARTKAERNGIRYGALRSQLASWVSEFHRIVRGSSSEVPLSIGAPGDIAWAKQVARQTVEECKTNERRNTSMLGHLQRVLEPQQQHLIREVEAAEEEEAEVLAKLKRLEERQGEKDREEAVQAQIEVPQLELAISSLDNALRTVEASAHRMRDNIRQMSGEKGSAQALGRQESVAANAGAGPNHINGNKVSHPVEQVLLELHAAIEAIALRATRLRAARDRVDFCAKQPIIERWLNSLSGKHEGSEPFLSGRGLLRVTQKVVSRLALDRDEDQVGEVMVQMLLEDYQHAVREEARTSTEDKGVPIVRAHNELSIVRAHNERYEESSSRLDKIAESAEIGQINSKPSEVVPAPSLVNSLAPEEESAYTDVLKVGASGALPEIA